ncbi:23S rRNA (pseudouridine(1915)-N(3))-methyltransferase RlmH [Patescibacteria group bacterium]|nr:23S rRNA (pseudouridine(1915)-N(3))-methyltransferase RlmH [Patescibacteria group bacterium]
MRIRIIEIGKNKDRYIEEAVEEYLKRLSPYAKVEVLDLKQEKSVELEGERILKQLSSEEFVVVLDEHGKQLNSLEFAKEIGRLKDLGQTLIFVIGGAFGLSDAVRARADLILSFSKMTFTHQMIRPILLEQVYRGICIISGKEYHHS